MRAAAPPSGVEPGPPQPRHPFARVAVEEDLVRQALLGDLGVQGRGLEQLRVRPARLDAALLEHHDVVGQRDRRQPVGDDERRPAGHDLAQRGLDRLLGRGVDRGGRVVEDQDPRVGEEGARDREPLALPAGEREPALAHARVVAVGQLGDEAGRLGALGRALDGLPARVRIRVGDVVRDRVREQERVVVDDRDLPPQRGEVDPAQVGAVDPHAALRRVVEARQQLDQRGLARAGRADERHRGARLDHEVDVVEDLLGLLGVAERDVVELHPAAALGQLGCVGRGGQARRAVEHLEQPRARRRRALGQPERDPELAHRPDQHQQVGVEGGEVAQRQRPVHHLAPADEQDDGQAEVRQEADERVVEGAQPRGRHVLVEHARDRAAEAAHLALLGGEGLDHAHAGDVLLDVGRQLGDPLLDLLQRGPRAPPVAGGDEDDERDGGEGERAQLGLEREHRHRGEEDRERALGDEHEPVAEEEAHGLQIDGRARHQLSGLLAREEAQLELLQVGVDDVAQVDLDGERDPAGDEPAEDGEHEPPERGRGDEARRELETAPVVVADGVDGLAGEERNQHRGAHREPRQHERPDGCGPVRAQERQESPEGAHAINSRTARRTGPETAYLQHSRIG
jgi:hypothetical protein